MHVLTTATISNDNSTRSGSGGVRCSKAPESEEPPSAMLPYQRASSSDGLPTPQGGGNNSRGGAGGVSFPMQDGEQPQQEERENSSSKKASISFFHNGEEDDACSHCFGVRMVVKTCERVQDVLADLHLPSSPAASVAATTGASSIQLGEGSITSMFGLDASATSISGVAVGGGASGGGSSECHSPIDAPRTIAQPNAGGSDFNSPAKSGSGGGAGDTGPSPSLTFMVGRGASNRSSATSATQQPRSPQKARHPHNQKSNGPTPRSTMTTNNSSSAFSATPNPLDAVGCDGGGSSPLRPANPLNGDRRGVTSSPLHPAPPPVWRASAPSPLQKSIAVPGQQQQQQPSPYARATMRILNGWNKQDVVQLTAVLLDELRTLSTLAEYRLLDPCTCASVATMSEVEREPSSPQYHRHYQQQQQQQDPTPAQHPTPSLSPPLAPGSGVVPCPPSDDGAGDGSGGGGRSVQAPRRVRLISGEGLGDCPVLSPTAGGAAGSSAVVTLVATDAKYKSHRHSVMILDDSQRRLSTSHGPSSAAAGGSGGLSEPQAKRGRTRSVAFATTLLVDDDALAGSLLAAGGGPTYSPDGDSPMPHTKELRPRKSLMVSTTLTTTEDEDTECGLVLVNQYLMMEQIGAGAAGVVYEVTDTTSNRDFAMKVIKRDRFHNRRVSDDTDVVQMATNREVAIMKKLRHPNIVRLHEVIDDPTHKKLYLVMKLLTGGRLCPSLDMATGACEPVPADLLRRYVYQMCDGLRYLHQHNIIHRDVKPENMMLDEEGNVVLVDFGVSEVAADDACTVEGAIGTPAFMAPEVWDGDKVCGAAADVWSLGVSVFMMLVGRSPFPATTRTELIEQVRTRRPDFPPDMAPEWRSLLIGTLTKDPATRTSLSAIMRNPMFAEFRPLDASTSQRPSALRGAIVVTDDDVHDAIATREDIEVEITVGTIGDNSTACELESGERHTSLLTTEHQQEPDTATAATGNAVTAKSIAVAPISSVGGPLGSTRVSVAVEDEASRESSTMRSVDALPLSGGGGACGTGGSFELDATVPFHHQRTSMLLLDEAKFHRALARRHSSAPPAAFMESS